MEQLAIHLQKALQEKEKLKSEIHWMDIQKQACESSYANLRRELDSVERAWVVRFTILLFCFIATIVFIFSRV